MATVCHITRTWDDGDVDTYVVPWPGYTPKAAYERRLKNLREWNAAACVATDKAHLTITRHGLRQLSLASIGRSAIWTYTETLRFLQCAPYVYPIPLDDDATEYGAECACGWRVDGVCRETARREADEHGGCDE